MFRHLAAEADEIFLGERLKVQGRALVHGPVERIDFIDKGSDVGDDFQGDRLARGGVAEFAAQALAGDFAERLGHVLLKILVLDVEAGHRQAGDAGEAVIGETFQAGTGFEMKFLHHHHAGAELAGLGFEIRGQSFADPVGAVGVGGIEAAFAGGAADQEGFHG